MNDANTLLSELKNHLEDNDGEIVYWGPAITVPAMKTAAISATPIERAKGFPSAGGESVKVEGEETGAALRNLKTNVIGDCRLCPLSETRIQVVFGVGNPTAPVMFIGEGPGFDEDRQGEPFVGKAGQLLDKILAAIQLDRTKVYIANIVKCHPMVDPTLPEKRGNDRPPSPDEMEKCLPFLIAQIEIIQPKIIVTLGATATKALLKRSEGITRIRGKLFQEELIAGHEPITVLPTFHPAALLRDETLKRPVWEDMKLLRTLIDQLK